MCWRIYQAGLDGGNASFETVAPTWAAFDAGKLPEHRFVAVDADGAVVGWVAVSPASARPSTPGWSSTPSTSTRPPKGAASARLLLDALIASTEAAGIWTIQSGVFPENTASSPCTTRPGSASSASANGSAGTTAWRDVILLERAARHLNLHPTAAAPHLLDSTVFNTEELLMNT